MTSSLIVGCGFTGSKLAELLVEEGHKVYGVTKQGSVSADNVIGLKKDVRNKNLDLPSCDYIFYLISAPYRDLETYKEIFVDGLKNTLKSTSGDLIYSSSTGVYEQKDGSWVDEKTDIDPISERVKILRKAEKIALKHGKIARLSGLYGPNRYGFDRYLNNKVKSGYVNLIHRDDAASGLKHIALEGEHDTYIVVDDKPINTHKLASWLSEKTGKKTELIDQPKNSSKRCSNSRLKREGWSPKYPTFKEGYKEPLKREIYKN